MAAAPVTSAAGVEVTSAGKGPVYLGYDFGTSGARVVAIDAAGTELFDAKQPYQVIFLAIFIQEFHFFFGSKPA